jgi:hypothetical protein
MLMSRWVMIFTCAALLTSGCEKSTRTKNSAGSSSLVNELETTKPPIYTFVSAEQSLTDARSAFAAEKWVEAQAAAQALLEKQPENAEARTLRDRSKLETQSQTSFTRLNKAAAATDGVALAKAWRDISDESVYKDRARPEFDRVKLKYLATQQNEAERLTRIGKCEEAKRLVRNAADYFPDARAELEAIPVGCKPARDDRPRVEVASIKDKPEYVAPAAAGSEQPAAAPSAGETAPAPAPVKQIVETAPAPVKVAPHKIVAADLEALRISGERYPTLPAGAKNIARRDQVKNIQLMAEVCISDGGVPSSVKLVRPSDYNDANEKILADIRHWRFKAYLDGGKPTPVCTVVLLRYSIED